MANNAFVRSFVIVAVLVATGFAVLAIQRLSGTAQIPTASIGDHLPDSGTTASKPMFNETRLLAPVVTIDRTELADFALLSKVREFQSLSRVTDEPHEMHPQIAGACGISLVADVHGQRFCDVFVTNDALQTIRSGKGSYAPGALIVKAKYPLSDRKNVELFTVMRKRNPGYSPEHGDWEYSVVDANARQVLARGKITSCIECHDSYTSTDFVTRKYMKQSDAPTSEEVE